MHQKVSILQLSSQDLILIFCYNELGILAMFSGVQKIDSPKKF